MPDSNDAIEKLEDLGAIVVDGKSGLLVSFYGETKVDEVIPLLCDLDNVVSLDVLHDSDVSNHHIKAFRNNSCVKKLTFNANSGLSEEAFSVLPTFLALEELILKVNTDLDPESVFKSVGACKNLTKLMLVFPTSHDAESHLRFLTKLHDLDIRCQLHGLKFVEQMKSLSRLCVGENPIADDDLLSMRCFSNLRELSLFNTNISDKCGPTLRKFANLRSLLVSGTRVTSQILPHLIALPKLTDLGIYNCGIGVDSMSLLTQMKNLETLTIPRELFTSSQFHQLCKNLPTTRVTQLAPRKRRQ